MDDNALIVDVFLILTGGGVMLSVVILVYWILEARRRNRCD